eukprot:11221592-Lingulodinium_polyedra.AAC.1
MLPMMFCAGRGLTVVGATASMVSGMGDMGRVKPVRLLRPRTGKNVANVVSPKRRSGPTVPCVKRGATKQSNCLP